MAAVSPNWAPGFPTFPEGTFGHLPGTRQIYALPVSGQRRALGKTGASIGRYAYAAKRHGGLSLKIVSGVEQSRILDTIGLNEAATRCLYEKTPPLFSRNGVLCFRTF